MVGPFVKANGPTPHGRHGCSRRHKPDLNGLACCRFGKYPELAVFLVVGLGYWVGGFKFRGFGLGPVTGSLVVGVLVGCMVEVPISRTAKSMLFLLFLFSIGYSVGPKFFQAMKGDGLRWAMLAVAMCCFGLGAAYGVARFLNLDPGFAAGLLSGALTESPAIGTASEAIRTCRCRRPSATG